MSSGTPHPQQSGARSEPPDDRAAGDWLSPEEYVDTIENATLYACLLFTDEQEQLFMLHTSRPEHGQIWQFAGGNVEKGATPWDTARQECWEETGLLFAGPPVLLAVHYIKPSAAWPRGKIGVVFDGGTLTSQQLTAVRVDPREHTHWEAHTPDEWRGILTPAQFARVSRWLRGREQGAASYFCDSDRATVPTGNDNGLSDVRR